MAPPEWKVTVPHTPKGKELTIPEGQESGHRVGPYTPPWTESTTQVHFPVEGQSTTETASCVTAEPTPEPPVDVVAVVPETPPPDQPMEYLQGCICSVLVNSVVVVPEDATAVSDPDEADKTFASSSSWNFEG